MNASFLPIDEFQAHAAEWDALNDAHHQLPILSSTFVRALLDHFPAGTHQLLHVTDNGTLKFAAIVDFPRPGAIVTWQPGQAPVGLAVYSADLDFQAATHAVFRARRLTAMLDLLQMDSRHFPSQPLPDGCELTHYIDTSWIDCQGEFDDYWESLGSNIKRNLRKDAGKLERAAIQVCLVTHSDPSAMAAVVAAHGELESAGWKGELHSAIHAENAQGRFYTDVLQAFAAHGAAHAYQLYYNDQLVASDFGISSAACIVILKTAYRHTERDTSPAQLLRRQYFPLLFEQFAGGRIEFYGRTLEWHQRWTKQSRALVHATFYSSTLARALVHSARSLRAQN